MVIMGVHLMKQTTYIALDLNLSQKNQNIYRKKNIITNSYRIQAYDLIMCRYFGIGFIDFMLKGKNWLNFTNSFSRNEYEKNNNIILKSFQ